MSDNDRHDLPDHKVDPKTADCIIKDALKVINESVLPFMEERGIDATITATLPNQD